MGRLGRQASCKPHLPVQTKQIVTPPGEQKWNTFYYNIFVYFMKKTIIFFFLSDIENWSSFTPISNYFSLFLLPNSKEVYWLWRLREVFDGQSIRGEQLPLENMIEGLITQEPQTCDAFFSTEITDHLFQKN